MLFKAQNVNPLSRENEERALKRLKVLCIDAIKEFLTTREEDLELLKNVKLTFNQRNCILYRASEKAVFGGY